VEKRLLYPYLQVGNLKPKRRRSLMEDKQLLGCVKGKFHHYLGRFSDYFNRPDWKFLVQMCFGILESGEVKLSKIAQALGERTSLKKTTERLARHLGRVVFWQEILSGVLHVQRRALRSCQYLVFDISDIQKSYASCMEGLAWVHDGSKSNRRGDTTGSVGLGYWLANVVGVSSDGSRLVPAYSELYSLDWESTSENQKMLAAIRTVCEVCGKEGIWVLDRGGDRFEVMFPLVKEGINFVIRQNGRRQLWYGGKRRSFRWVSRQAKLNYTSTVRKKHKNRNVERTYSAGAVRVRLTPGGPDLWLVVSKAEGRGYTWYLSHLSTDDEQEAVELALRGYGYRWKIEEVHRHVKAAYNWEGICLRRYVALKNMNAVFWMAMSFVYSQLESVPLELFTRLNLIYKHKVREVLGFIYYKLSVALKLLFARCTLRLKALYRWPDKSQLTLNLGYL
jgi:hypothetical protein